MINKVLNRNHRSPVSTSVEMRNKEIRITFRQFRYISRLLMTLSENRQMRNYFSDFIGAVLTLNMKEASLLIRVLLGTLKYEKYLERKEKSNVMNGIPKQVRIKDGYNPKEELEVEHEKVAGQVVGKSLSIM